MACCSNVFPIYVCKGKGVRECVVRMTTLHYLDCFDFTLSFACDFDSSEIQSSTLLVVYTQQRAFDNSGYTNDQDFGIYINIEYIQKDLGIDIESRLEWFDTELSGKRLDLWGS